MSRAKAIKKILFLLFYPTFLFQIKLSYLFAKPYLRKKRKFFLECVRKKKNSIGVCREFLVSFIEKNLFFVVRVITSKS